MSVFSTWLRQEMAARGMSNRQLAHALDTGDSTIHDWLEQDAIPNVRSIVLLSRLFNIPTEQVIEMVGYHVVPSRDKDEREQRRAAAFAHLPRYASIAEKIARLKAETQDAYLSVIEKLLPLDDLDD